MPNYNYQCSGCGLTFELQRTIAERNTMSKCPNCDNPAKKIITASSITKAVKNLSPLQLEGCAREVPKAGIFLGNSVNPIVVGNSVQGVDVGVSLHNCKSAKLSQNRINDVRTAIKITEEK